MPSLNAGALGVALSTLRSNQLRTLLSTLGIVMGMASLVAVLSIGDGLERFARDQVSRTTDVQTIVVQPKDLDLVHEVQVPPTDYARFDLTDRKALQDRLDSRSVLGIANPVWTLAVLAPNGSWQTRNARRRSTDAAGQ